MKKSLKHALHTLHARTFLFAIAFLFSHLAFAQNVLVNGAVTGNGSYADLGSAFTAINSGAQTGATISVTITGNTTESATATLNQGTWTTLSIFPSGSAARSISGNIAGPLIDLNGTDRVLIDGLNTGGNSLTIDNSNTGAASTIRFINDARAIVIQNCTLLGANTSTTSGTLFFSTASSLGNDSIAVNTCTINASGANFPINGIYSLGTAGQENDHITISNSNIPNYFSATGVSAGILVSTANSDWTISGCRFYQSATRTYTTANTHRAIQVGSGNGHIITGNIIGYATAAATGTYIMTSTVATRFIGIDLAVGTSVATSVQGNTVTAISLSTSSGAATTNGILCGINITAGTVNVGTITGNTIGAASGAGALSATPTSTQGAIVGINTSSSGTISIQNNTIGGFSSIGSTASIAGAVFGINISGTANGLTISGNTIGNPTAGNMNAGTFGVTTGSSLAGGINITTSPTGTVLISGNTIQNFNSYGTGTSGYVRGIITPLSSSTLVNYTITGNTITNLATSGAITSITSGVVCAAGIQFFSSGTTGSVVSNNTITNISGLNTGTGQYVVAGITLAAASTVPAVTVSGNQVYNLSNAGTGVTATTPPVVAGIAIRSGPTNPYNIINNMISLGNGQTTNTAFVGIWGNHGSTPNPTIVNVYHNTINIEGAVGSGAHSTFCFLRGDFNIQRTIPVDVRNNIFTNTRTGGTGGHYAIGNNFNSTASATGWGANASNNNVLNANASTIGSWGAALTFAGWQAASACDGASWSGITVTYVNSTNNLHLNMGTSATVMESGGQTIASVTTDIDGQVRPGPAGSVNGGAFLPDAGADEFDGVPLDLQPPTITYTPLTFTCAMTNRTLTATIADLSGVPTTGLLQPRIYYRKNAGPWFSSQGALATGNATNGTWTFTIIASDMGGLAITDVVDYFVIAQDVLPNIASNPSAGLVASDVNTVTTAPTTPNTYPISGTLSGTYMVGTSQTYTTLTQAVNAYNTSCLSGPVTFILTDMNYSASETFPISINANPDANAMNTLTIKPQNAGTTITGSGTTLIKLNGADYVTIDGSISSTTNSICPSVATASRDLTLSNTSTSASTAVIWISSAGAGAGATNNTIKNCILSNGVDQSVTATENYDIVSCGATISAFPPPDGLDNNNNTIENNNLIRATWGIYLRGGNASSNSGNIVRQNTIGPAAFGSNQIRKGGIILQNQNLATVSGNEVRFVGNQISQSVGGTDHIGIGIGGADGPSPGTSNVTNTTVTKNVIHDIVCEKTFSAIGIVIAVPGATSTNNVIANNFIYNVRSNATSPDQGIGIDVSNGNGEQIVFNTIYMVTADRDPASSTTASQSDIGVRFQAGAVNTTFVNNLVYVDEASNTATLKNFAMVAPSVTYTWAMCSYNDYSINAANPQNVLFGLGTIGTLTDVTTLAAWQTTFVPNVDMNSATVVPVFTSSTDLHLLPGSNATLENLGTPVAGVTDDIDCGTRSATPDMGADESCNLADIPVVTAMPNPICVGATVSLSLTGSLNEASDWQWYSVSCGGIPAGSGTSITVTPGSTTDYFVRGEGGCSVTGICNMLTVIVNPLPVITATPSSATVCDGDMLTLAGNGAVTYMWSGPQPITDNMAFSATIGGTYTVTGTDANSCTDTATVAVMVNPLPVVTATPSSIAVCTGGSVTLAGGGAVTYTWNGPETIADNTPFVPTVNGTYTVTGTDANTCSNTTTASVTVNPFPNVTASPSSATACSGDPVTLSGGGAVSYTWSGPESITDNTAFVPTVSGTYTVTGTDGNSCSNTATASVTVNPLPSVTLTVPDTSCTSGPVITFTGGSPSGGTYFYTGNPVTTFDPSTAPLGPNEIIYVYTDSNTCTSQDTATILVDICLDAMAVENSGAMEVYPNPSSGIITIEFAGNPGPVVTIRITNATGQVLSEQQVSGSMYQVDLGAYADGVYFIHAEGDGFTIVKRVVLSR
jgi:trimeric autotransporter adhesin